MPSERLARLEAQSEQTHKLVCDLHKHVVGAPGSDGLVTRVSKVEQRQSMLMKILATLGTTVLAVTVWVVKGRT